jgi:hypothetical protein
MLPARSFVRRLTASHRTPVSKSCIWPTTPYLTGKFNFCTSTVSTNAASGVNAVPLLINGRETKTGQPFDLKHPRTGEVVTRVHGASKQDL